MVDRDSYLHHRTFGELDVSAGSEGGAKSCSVTVSRLSTVKKDATLRNLTQSDDMA